ncbi:MAG: hypothetical protein JW846_09810 [Dehalococcoidia bacterium]|nr:hypothetical protein [Dehalococcoidia bacterium]
MEKSRGLTVRTVYLYVATLIGLSLIIAGGVQAFELILKATILTQADAEEEMWARQPPVPYMLDRVKGVTQTVELTEDEQLILRNWMDEYEDWSERQANLDVVAARRQQRAATALALVFVGVPVYLYHWRTIKRELRAPFASSPEGNG